MPTWQEMIDFACPNVLLSVPSVPVEMSHEKRLIRDLIRDYKSLGIMGRPVKDQNETITISYGLSLIQIMDLDERNQILTTNVWATYVSPNVAMATVSPRT